MHAEDTLAMGHSQDVSFERVPGPLMMAMLQMDK